MQYDDTTTKTFTSKYIAIGTEGLFYVHAYLCIQHMHTVPLRVCLWYLYKQNKLIPHL